MTVEQLEKRVDLLQKVILALGYVIAKHVPSVTVDLANLGMEWTDAEEKINEEQTK